jgi:DNA polymerase I
MIVLVDLGFEFWRNYFGSGSDVAAYEQTLERVQFYHENYPRVALCCEGRGLKRREWATDYKETRKPKPQDAIDSLVAIGQQIASWGVPVVAADGYEGDDIVASLVKQAWIEEVGILSGDKDLYQLLSPTVKLIGRQGPIGPAECVAKFGVKPEQMRDWLALVGDAVDNVKGCPNVGPGRARDLLQHFGTLDAIMAASTVELGKIRGVGLTTIASLKAWDPTLAVKLVTLLDDAPVDLANLWANPATEPAPPPPESEIPFL